MFPQDIEILSWFPVGPVLGASLALVGHPSSDGVNKNALWDRCFTWTSFAPHLFLMGWLKMNLALLLDQWRRMLEMNDGLGR